GIAKRLFEFSLPKLKELQAKQYILEVIENNLSAIKAYSNLGFRETRKYQSYKLEGKTNRTNRTDICDVQYRDVLNADWELYKTFWDFQPSWQNSINSINRSLIKRVIVGAYLEDRCFGYGIVFPSTGDIPQIAVDKSYRKKGIGSEII